MTFSPHAARVALLATLFGVAGGCRSTTVAERPFESSRTFAAAQADPESHVFNVTLHAPTHPIRFRTPQSLARSLAVASAGYLLHERFRQATGRSLAFHMLGHAMIEVKSVGEDGRRLYLLSAVTDTGDGETARLILKQQVGFSLADFGTRGRLESFDEVARDVDEAAETNVRAVRVRFLVSPQASARMLQFAEEFERRRVFERYSLTGSPLDGTGAGCTSLVAAFLEVAGVLDDGLKERWTVRLRVPDQLFGDPVQGTRVPVRRLFFGPRTRRWATEREPHRLLTFYDTTAMFEWARELATAPACRLPPGTENRGPVECDMARRLGMPVVTIDLRGRPTPSGPVIRGPADPDVESLGCR